MPIANANLSDNLLHAALGIAFWLSMTFSIFFYALLREINKEEGRRSTGKSEKLRPENMATRMFILLGSLVVRSVANRRQQTNPH